ncbi:hypothetical protein [Absidia glauca]|uniref:CUE domain-containing protein n=1 Tax=Absidia glauca TaxID=4829 RepID=A0A168RNU6_ABSGL|nr:hypothetical protein [Absidia glauca]
MIDLLPYIPRNTNGVSDELWKKGHTIWLSTLTDLLNGDDSSILDQMDRNSGLYSWCQTVLLQEIDQGNVDHQVLQLIFLVYVRSGDAISASGSVLPPSSPLTPGALDVFALVFARTNPTVVRRFFSQLFNSQSKLRDQYVSSVDQLVDTLESIDGYMATMASSSAATWQQACLERTLVVARLLETKVLCLGTYIPRLFPVLQSCYEQLLDRFAPSSVNGADTVEISYWTYLVKQSLVNTFNTLVEINYISPLGYATVDQSGNVEKVSDIKITSDAEAIVESLSDQILAWIEQCGVDSSKTVYVDAPLLMDWQVEWQTAKRLEHINHDLFHDGSEQLSFLSLVLETQIQELATGIQQSWGNRIKKQQEQRDASRNNNEASAASTPNNHSTTATASSADSIQRTSLISQVRDIFSDLGEGFVEACLVANNDDAEMVIMQLLEDNLPPSVASLDRSMERTTSPKPSHTTGSAPQTTSILDSRRNIFDKDEFDVFSGGIVQQNKVYLGKKNQGTTETLLENKKHTKDEKANMLRRIYDMYEDEIDDSYDSVNEMPGPVDLAAVDEGGQAALEAVRAKKEVDPNAMNESELVHMYVDHPQVFDRSSATRKSAQRDALRKRTNMSDEQLEGWAIMFNRNPRKQRILDKYMLFDGSQEQVGDKVKSEQQQKQKESASKPPPPSESKQRSYKDKNKARFGNHNRKKNHDKKLNKLAGPVSTS